MVKAVFTTKVEPSYDDLPESRYHFPRTYLRQVEAAVHDWIVYYEPRRANVDVASRGGRQAYFAVARVDGIRPDPARADHFYADVSQYLEFDRAVSFREGGRYFETGLMRADGKTSKGSFGRAVRAITDREYDGILRSGFATLVAEVDHRLLAPIEFGEEPETFDRPIIERIAHRPFRDEAFKHAIKQAYENTCAMTGLRIINGGGRSEVQAAHIRPVSEKGPDSVRNGLALSGTVHWMFDRGLLSIADDYRILVADGHVPEPIRRLLLPRLGLPSRPEFRPHPQFLRFHRATFKGTAS